MQARLLMALGVFAGLAGISGAGCNSAPRARDDVVTTGYAYPVEADVLANDSDDDGEPMRLSAVSKPLNGTASIKNDRTVLFAPNPGFSGREDIRYWVKDEDGKFGSAVVHVTVGPEPRETTLPASAKKSDAESHDWRAETVSVKSGSPAMILKGPFQVKQINAMPNGTEPIVLYLGPVTGPTEPIGNAVPVTQGKTELFVPEGKALYAKGQGMIAYTGYPQQ